MLIIQVIAYSLAVIMVAIAIDFGPEYIREINSKLKTRKKENNDKADRNSIEDDPEISKGISAYRNYKKLQYGLFALEARRVTVERPRGLHRRPQAS